MNPYAGDPDSFPATFDVPDDSDPPAAATFNVAPEALGDRTMALAVGYRTELANTTALKAVDTTSLPDGAIRRVNGLGRFVLDKTVYPTFAETLPIVVAPTTGTGRWYAADDVAKRLWIVAVTAAGAYSINTPPNIARVHARLIGGGGGGGGGAGGDTLATSLVMAGGGGKAARLLAFDVDVTPGGTLSGSVGAGGTAGAAGGAGGFGGDGGNGGASTVVDVVTQVAKAAGGAAGLGGHGSAGTGIAITPGGAGPSGTATPSRYETAPPQFLFPILHEGDGGYAASYYVNPNDNAAGAPSFGGFSGGAAGHRGATNTKGGGGGGGGGGASDLGAGGAGGFGGDGAAAGAGNPGQVGSVPIANTGAGGGGGGAGGSGTVATSLGGAGIAGASGYLEIRGVH